MNNQTMMVPVVRDFLIQLLETTSRADNNLRFSIQQGVFTKLDLESQMAVLGNTLNLSSMCAQLPQIIDHAPQTHELHEAARYAMRRLETIREAHPEIDANAEIERLRAALAGEPA